MKTSQFAVHMGIQLTITVLHETFIRHPICDVQITVSILFLIQDLLNLTAIYKLSYFIHPSFFT